MTAGNIIAQETSQDRIQFETKCPVAQREKLAIAAAMQLVNPDWMIPKTKWL